MLHVKGVAQQVLDGVAGCRHVNSRCDIDFQRYRPSVNVMRPCHPRNPVDDCVGHGAAVEASRSAFNKVVAALSDDHPCGTQDDEGNEHGQYRVYRRPACENCAQRRDQCTDRTEEVASNMLSGGADIEIVKFKRPDRV